MLKQSAIDWDNRPKISDMPIRYSMNTLSTQYSILQRLNEQMSEDLRVPDSWLEDPAIKFAEPNDEDVTNFFSYFVQKEDFRSTLEYNIELLRIRFGQHFYVSKWVLMTPIQLSEVACVYEPGIHIIRTNLVEGWSPNMSIESSNRQINEAKSECSRLFGLEILSLFALQNESFLKKFDGIKYPKYNLLGLQIDNLDCSLALCYGIFGKNITLTPENNLSETNNRIPLKSLVIESSF